MTPTGTASGGRLSNPTYLGFDYGTRKIGIAVGQALTRTARELDTVRVKGSSPDWRRVSEHVEAWRPTAFVVGLPLDTRGGETNMSRLARQFGQTLANRYNLEVYWVNEFLSTEAARHALSAQDRRRALAKKDQVAARLILETFLNEQHLAQKDTSN